MTILKAITCGDDENLQGKEVAIRDGIIARCPGCSSEQVGVIENEDFGLVFIKRHNMPPIVGTTVVQCDYSCEPLKIVASNEKIEAEAILH